MAAGSLWTRTNEFDYMSERDRAGRPFARGGRRLHPEVRWQQMSVTDVGFSDGSFDVVNCRLEALLHFLSDHVDVVDCTAADHATDQTYFCTKHSEA